jgi:hypothetical protein
MVEREQGRGKRTGKVISNLGVTLDLISEDVVLLR